MGAFQMISQALLAELVHPDGLLVPIARVGHCVPGHRLAFEEFGHDLSGASWHRQPGPAICSEKTSKKSPKKHPMPHRTHRTQLPASDIFIYIYIYTHIHTERESSFLFILVLKPSFFVFLRLLIITFVYAAIGFRPSVYTLLRVSGKKL